MDNPGRNPKTPGKKKSPTEEETNSMSPLDVEAQLQQAYHTYFLALRDVWCEAEKKTQEAWQQCLSVQQQVRSDAEKRVEDAYIKFMKSLEEASNSENPAEAFEESYRELIKEQQRAWSPDDELKCFKAYRSYLRTAQSACSRETIQSQIRDIFRRYLESVKSAWSQLDTSSIDATSLTGLAYSMAAVVSNASNQLREQS